MSFVFLFYINLPIYWSTGTPESSEELPLVDDVEMSDTVGGCSDNVESCNIQSEVPSEAEGSLSKHFLTIDSYECFIYLQFYNYFSVFIV